MKRFILFASVFMTIASSPMVRAETTTPLTDEYIAAIREGCSDALQGLLQIERSEAVTRVNRGRAYESLLQLIAAFNSRVVLNKLDAPVLTRTAANIQNEFSSFQQNYLDYADKLDATLEINCRDAPVTFYDNLTAAREARAKVATDVRDIETLLDEYQKGLDGLKQDLAGLGSEVAR